MSAEQSTAQPVAGSVTAQAADDQTVLAARERGLLAAAVFEQSLRQEESRQREDLFGRQVWAPAGAGQVAGDAAATIQRLQAEVDHYSGFYSAVVNSKSWRLIQVVRRLVGRGW